MPEEESAAPRWDMDSLQVDSVTEPSQDAVPSLDDMGATLGSWDDQTGGYLELEESTQEAKTTRSKAPVIAAVIAAVVAVVAIVVYLVTSSHAPKPMPAEDVGSVVSEANTTEGTSGSVVNPQAEAPVADVVVQAIARPRLIVEAKLVAPAPVTAQVGPYAVEPGLTNIENAGRIYMRNELREPLLRNGFAVDDYRGLNEYFEVYETNRYQKDPSFVTVDSMMHTYHLYFQYLQKHTETDHLAQAIKTMGERLLATSEAQLAAVAGSEWEEAARRNVAFFAVGVRLQDPSHEVPADVAGLVDDEVGRIQAASGMAQSAITGLEEDYTQYKPRGYYEGDPTLEAYFRTMCWYGRVNFTQSDESLDRSALLATLALEGDALAQWEAVYAVTSFFAGESDDNGYCEYRPLITTVYGEDATVDKLVGDDASWKRFHALTATMEPPRVSSLPAKNELGAEEGVEAQRGFRLLGQRFTLDAMVFTQLLSPEVGKNASGASRLLPDVLDVPAAFGSDTALRILEERGATGYEGYSEHMGALRTELETRQSEYQNESLASMWLYTLDPLLNVKGEGYPPFMQGELWARKSLQTYLGSYTELKHDTVLYGKQVMAEGGGGNMNEVDDRGYVEPEPEVFDRLANLTSATRDGLAGYGLLTPDVDENLTKLNQLATQLATIARKELTNELPTDDEFELIRSYGMQLEHFWIDVVRDRGAGKHPLPLQFPAALVVDVATNADAHTVLELGCGMAKTIYAIVPVDGILRIAKGSTYSFYQFEQPMSERVTDSTWHQMVGIDQNAEGKYEMAPQVHAEDWASDFLVP